MASWEREGQGTVWPMIKRRTLESYSLDLNSSSPNKVDSAYGRRETSRGQNHCYINHTNPIFLNTNSAVSGKSRKYKG